ncbi:MAG: tetratricopeptide repeat protein [Calditrichaceae bacterium]|nr:tetratricopeptide repeat protein [Calditrichaceae bacterium]
MGGEEIKTSKVFETFEVFEGSEAEPLHRRALEICEKALGKDHPNTKTVRENLERLLAEKK